MSLNVSQSQTQKLINRQLVNKLQLAYFAVDGDMNVSGFSENLTDYGFPVLQLGVPVSEQIDFMIGIEPNTELDLPMMSSPAGVPISVNMIPDENQLTVLISNATVATEQRRMLQQAANENELLVEKQKKLMHQLECASKELENKNKQLEEASRLQTSFLSGVSHEFRTPLTSIIGYTNLLQKNLTEMGQEIVPRVSGQGSDGYLNAVQRSSKHLLSLVENLLDHGKLDSNEIFIRPKACNVQELFDDVQILLAPLSETKGIDLDVSLNVDHDQRVVIDDSRLRQCLINLVGNAIKFTDEGKVKLSANIDHEQLSVQVEDTGMGISAEDLEKIRLPFYQAPDTGKVGTGLGLTITERIIELMGGKLDIQSELGHGTKVNFMMPAPRMPDSTENDELAASFAKQKLKILLAEDDSDIAALVQMMLIEKDVDVVHVGNGALAVEAAMGREFDLILMDIHMPVMTGYEAIAELNKLGSTTPVVVMSASAIEADQQRAMELGCAAYLVKPVDIGEILSIATTVVLPN